MNIIEIEKQKVPIFTQLPPLHSIPGSNTYTEGEWGWHNVRELRSCIEEICESQGCNNPSADGRRISFSSFEPTNGKFTWITESVETGKLTLCEGGIDLCNFYPPGNVRIFVPAFWGIGVAKVAKEFGVVVIRSSTPSGAVWAQKWQNEYVRLEKNQLFWRR